MHDNTKRVRITVVALLALVALSLGIFVSQYIYRVSPKEDMAQFHGTWLDQPRDVKAFDLVGTKGAFTPASLNGHWTMMFFGFTTCQSICPTTMVELSKMIQLLKEEGVKPLPQVVLVSLDPSQDTVEKLNQYVTAFNPQFLGATGKNDDVVKAMASEMGVAYTKTAISNDKNNQHYNIEHTGTVMLFNPEGKLNAFFTMPHQAASLAEDYRLAMSASRSYH